MNQELRFAKKLARDAGAIMLKYFNQTGISHYKSDCTIVTKADTEINQMVIERVRRAYPAHGVYGEEKSFGRDKKTLWVCDPVDGTAMFARGMPVAVFSLALVVDGEPQLGVVYDPFTERLYEATLGGGAFCNDRPIQVNNTKFGDKTAVGDVGLYGSSEISRQVQRVAKVISQKLYQVHLGSCVNSCMKVASGDFICRISEGTKGKNVDMAAAKIIVEEAGGKVTNIYGEDQRYDRDIRGAVVSNGIVHDEIIDIIKGEK